MWQGRDVGSIVDTPRFVRYNSYRGEHGGEKTTRASVDMVSELL